jgi:hypothetical protein
MFILLVCIILITIILVIDHFLFKRWVKNITENINNIFDGIKKFVYIVFIEKLTSASHEEDQEEDSGEL